MPVVVACADAGGRWVVRGVYALVRRYNARVALSRPIGLYSLSLAIYGAYTGRVVYVVGDFPIYAKMEYICI